MVGCALDLTVPIITFYLNGRQVNGAFTGFNLDGMFFPVVSASSKLRCVERGSFFLYVFFNLFYFMAASFFFLSAKNCEGIRVVLMLSEAV